MQRNPITGIVGCCARAANGHAAALPKQRDELASSQLIELHPIHTS
jgi:hypothetical protein